MDTLKRTKEWFELAVPEPELKNFNSQLGCHFEEVAELLDCVTGISSEASSYIDNAQYAIESLADYLKGCGNSTVTTIMEGREVDFIDALCDQTVTATGVAHMMGHDFIGAMDEVNRSNFSKFVDGKPVFNTNSKIIKGNDYFEPDLKPFLKV